MFTQPWGGRADAAGRAKQARHDVQAAGSAHGSPHHYDTHVPLIWFGPGIRPGVHLERIGIDDLAPTLAALLQVPVPPQARGRRLF